MVSKSTLTTLLAVIVVTVILAVGIAPTPSGAASHREAPLIALDPTADISDFFMFRSYEQGQHDNIVLIMDVIPGEEPSSGPNYWNFDPNVRYSFHIDNDMDGKANDIEFQFLFETETREVIDDLGLPLSYVAIPPITALDGPGSEGLGLRQRYKVIMKHNGHRTKLADGLIAVPSNVGPRTMPNYDDLADQGIYTLDNGIQVFAGQRDDPFYIDLGAVFDTLNLRDPGTDMLSGFNVHTIALSIPARLLTQDGKRPERTAHPHLGAYASTSRKKTTILDKENLITTRGAWVQVQRLANPLVNELIIATRKKDYWNRLKPSRENKFEEFYLTPRLALALELVLGVPAAQENRTDLVDLLLKYHPDDHRLSELLRLDISTHPFPLSHQHRLGGLGGDESGYPNGRRPNDDVTDISVQVVGGPEYIAIQAGDGVNANDLPLPDAFPFLASPHDGRDRFHTNP